MSDLTSSLCEYTWLSLISSVSNCQKDGDLCRPLALAMGWLFTCQPLYGLMNQIYIIRSHLENQYLCVWLLAYIEFKKEKLKVKWKMERTPRNDTFLMRKQSFHDENWFLWKFLVWSSQTLWHWTVRWVRFVQDMSSWSIDQTLKTCIDCQV